MDGAYTSRATIDTGSDATASPYLTLGAIVHALPPREATEMLVGKARQRARGSGDNLSLALVRVEQLT